MLIQIHILLHHLTMQQIIAHLINLEERVNVTKHTANRRLRNLFHVLQIHYLELDLLFPNTIHYAFAPPLLANLINVI